MVGNSSAGIREAPFYGVPTINIGTRQKNRMSKKANTTIVNCDINKDKLVKTIKKFSKRKIRYSLNNHFGEGKSSQQFYHVLTKKPIWDIKIQKYFVDVDFK